MFDALNDDKRFFRILQTNPIFGIRVVRRGDSESGPSRDPVARTYRTPIQKGRRKSRFNPRLIPPPAERDGLSHCHISFQHQIRRDHNLAFIGSFAVEEGWNVPLFYCGGVWWRPSPRLLGRGKQRRATG
ncbi:unnamed protein product [Musa acuminata var. zebrina]